MLKSTTHCPHCDAPIDVEIAVNLCTPTEAAQTSAEETPAERS